MDDLLTLHTENKDIVTDKKQIEFKFFNEKRTNRTYIYNLEEYIRDPELLKVFLKKLKKNLGTSCTQKKTEFGVAYGFNGDQQQRIKQAIIDNKIATIDDFVKPV